MIDPTPQNIRNSVIETIITEHIEIFWISIEDRVIVRNNLIQMTDIELWKEIMLIEEFHSKSNHIYQKALIATVHIKEEEEKLHNNNTILNF